MGGRFRRLVLLGLMWGASAWLAGCSGLPSLPNLSSLNPMNWIAAEKPKPAALETITPKLAVKQVWRGRVDSVKFPMSVTVVGNTFVAAGTDGGVVAINADTGTELWHASAGDKLTAGVGSDGRFSAVVTRDNQLVVFEAGALKWKHQLGGTVATAPFVAGERVFVIGVDRAVFAFDALNGHQIWALQRPGDALTLSQSSVVTSYKDTLLIAQGTRLTGVDPTIGTVRWEVPMASPRGTNEVERLADLVGPAVRTGELVCARAFQSAVACASAERGALVWTKTVGGIQAVNGDDQLIFGGDASDRMTAWKTPSGDVAWTNERFLHRGLSGPGLLGPAVVFGDSEGYVHFLSRDNGETLQRLQTDGSEVIGTPVTAGRTLLVVTRDGGLFGFRAE